jgi:hypothetical protein
MLAGFAPGDTPCATTHRNFLKRLVDGPYAVRTQQDAPLSQQLAGRHTRRLDDATTERAAAATAAGTTQSALLADTLLQEAHTPLNPHDLQTRLDHLFVELGLTPTLATPNLLPASLTVGGDGSIEPSGASGDGERVCACPPGTRCDCPRAYLSRTAQWCYDVHHGWTFGDRSYTISVHVQGHDLPLITIMPGGNESDFTVSLKALDRLLKLFEDLEHPPVIELFIGDKHHDALGIYRYLKAKGIVPVIPLDAPSQPDEPPSTPPATDPPTPTVTTTTTPRPAVAAYPHIVFEPDGTPRCPGGKRLRHHTYMKGKAAHLFACPCTRKNGADEWVFYAHECPFGQACTPPDKKMGYTLYLKSEADLRLFPPIPRASTRFKTLFAHRSGTERQNAVADSYQIDRRHRNAAYTLVRLTFVNICKHARVREAERITPATPLARLQDALRVLDLGDLRPRR